MSAPDPGAALLAVLADALTGFANRGLDLDPASRGRLGALEGRRIALAAELPLLGAQTVTLEVRDGALRRPRDTDVPPNVIVHGDPPALLAWIAGAPAGGAAGVRVDGDSTVLAEFRSALTGFRPDLEAPLSGVLGRELARDLVGGAELALNALRSAAEGGASAARAGATAHLADRRQFDVFLDQLDDLRLRVDRLTARVADQESRRKVP